MLQSLHHLLDPAPGLPQYDCSSSLLGSPALHPNLQMHLTNVDQRGRMTSVCRQQLAYCSFRGCLIIFSSVSTVPQVFLCKDTLQPNSLQNVLAHLSQEASLSLTPFCTSWDYSQDNSPAWQTPSDVYANCPSFGSSADLLKVHSVSTSRPWMTRETVLVPVFSTV